jgi:CRISPR-associated protein Cas1
VVIFGHVMITSGTLNLLMRHGIEVCYLTQHGSYVGRTTPEISKNGGLRLDQYRAAADSKCRLNLARYVVLGKLRNLRILLQQKTERSRTPEVKQALKRIKTAEKQTQKSRKLETLRAQEGEASAAYFSVFQQMYTNPDFAFTTRTRRPPTDPVNAMLSFGYTLLANDLYSAVNIVGFDPYIGYLHAEEYGRPSLPLDLMEEFRSLIVDTMVVSLINQNMLTPADFHDPTEAGCRMTDEGRKIFLQQYEERRMTEFTHPVLQRKMTYHQSFEQQVRQFAKALQGELDAYPPLTLQ